MVDYFLKEYKLYGQKFLSCSHTVWFYVFSTGTKGKYIFAKQQTISTPLKTNYFIIDTLENINTQKGVYGPLDKIEFEKLAKK